MTIFVREFKAFVFDIDGTLTDMRTWQVVPSAKQALDALQAKGLPVIIASGRAPYAAPNLEEAGIRPDYFVGTNGQIIADRQGRTVWQTRFERDTVRQINDFCRKEDLGLFWKYEHANYLVVWHPNIPRVFAGQRLAFPYENPDADEMPNGGALLCDPPGYQRFMARFRGQVDCVDGGLLLYDINQKGMSKKNGLEVLLKLLGIDPQQVMAFGDSENDIEMLQYAGVGVAMGDGQPQCRAQADYIAPAAADDGILKTLQAFHIL